MINIIFIDATMSEQKYNSLTNGKLLIYYSTYLECYSKENAKKNSSVNKTKYIIILLVLSSNNNFTRFG